jgi:hypothetical protein
MAAALETVRAYVYMGREGLNITTDLRLGRIVLQQVTGQAA